MLERISNLGTFQRRLKRPASRDKQTTSGAAMAVRLVIVKAPPYNSVHTFTVVGLYFYVISSCVKNSDI